MPPVQTSWRPLRNRYPKAARTSSPLDRGRWGEWSTQQQGSAALPHPRWAL